MANIFDYVHWRGDLSFNKSKFNEIDNIIFTQVCYVDFACAFNNENINEQVILKDAINQVFLKEKKEDIVLGLIVPYSIVELIDRLKDSKRYSNIKVSNYVNIVDKSKVMQFSAMCFHLSDNLIYIAFRGTDDNVIAWQEDLNMVAKFPVPAQKQALKYLNNIASLYPECFLILGGHSKGGNLANYAAIYCEDKIKERIIKVYNNDGPGFVKEKVDQDKFLSIKDKLVRIIPYSSIIGVTLDPFYGETKVVKANVRGIRQHDAFSWQIDVKNFVYEKELSENAKKFDDALTNMLYKLSEKERKEFSKDIYNFVIELNKNTLLEVQKDSIRFIRYMNKMTSKSKKLFVELIYNLIKCKLL